MSQPRTTVRPHTHTTQTTPTHTHQPHCTVLGIDLPTASLALVPLPASSPSPKSIPPPSTSAHKTHVCLVVVRPSAVFLIRAVLFTRHSLLHHWVTWCCVVVHSLVARRGSLIRRIYPIPFTFLSHDPLPFCAFARSATAVSCQAITRLRQLKFRRLF